MVFLRRNPSLLILSLAVVAMGRPAVVGVISYDDLGEWPDVMADSLVAHSGDFSGPTIAPCPEVTFQPSPGRAPSAPA